MPISTKIITGSIVALGLASMIAASPASAGGYNGHSNAGSIVGARIAGMAMGTVTGTANQSHHGGGYNGHPGYAGGNGYGYGCEQRYFDDYTD